MSLWLICFSYTSISDQTIPKQKQKQKKKQKKKNAARNFNLFYTDFIFVLQGSQLRGVLKKKKKSKNNYVYKF